MAEHLEISLLGRLALRLAGQPLSLPTRKTEALLVYLVCTGQPQPRELLAELLWQADSHTQARRNLTYTLYRLRQALEAYVVNTSQTIAFNQEIPYWVDVIELERQIKAAAQKARLAEPEAAALAEALALYQGDFLAGFHLADALDFEAWLAIERERLHQCALEGLQRLVSHYEQSANYTQGLQWTRRWLALDNLDELAQQQLIRLLALSGQRGPALAQYETYARLLQAEFRVEPSGAIQALREEIQSGQISPVEGSRMRAAFPAIPFQAPLPPPHFVGRERDIAELQRALTQTPAPRIHALVGMGGVGKTTLASQVAHQLREAFKDGVLWANAATSSPMDILVTWAKAYDHDFSGLADLESRAVAVRNLLADKQTLLVIDNVINSKTVEALLPNGQHCAALLTTRDLDVAHALNAEAWTVGELSPDSARQLLVYILGEARIAPETTAAWEICDLLQNLPLAVEIAAKRLKSRARQPLAQMAARLRETKNRLGLTISDQAVRASFEVSWEALDEELRQIFPLLAVFEGRPFAAEPIAYLAGLDLFQVEDHLYALVALSLVKEEGEAYFRQHPLLADFAQEKLGEVEAVYAQASNYYLAFAREHQENYPALQPEWANIQAALRVAYDQGRWQMVVGYTESLTHAWHNQGRYTDARQAYQWANNAAGQIQTVPAQNSLRWGIACIEQGDWDEALRHLAESLALYQALNERRGEADVHYALARIYIDRSRYEEARTALVQSLSIRAGSGDIEGVAETLHLQALLHHSLEAYEEARQVAEEALALQKNSADRRQMLPTLHLLTLIYTGLEQYAPARAYGEQAKTLSEELHDDPNLATTLYALTCVCQFDNDFELGQQYAQESLKLYRRMGVRHTEGQLLYQLSLINEKIANYEAALALAGQSHAIFQALQDQFGCIIALSQQGDLYERLGQPATSRQVWEEAIEMAQRINHAAVIEALENRLARLSNL